MMELKEGQTAEEKAEEDQCRVEYIYEDFMRRIDGD